MVIVIGMFSEERDYRYPHCNIKFGIGIKEEGQLFIDFTPSESGTIGQVVMFVHDSDRMEVIANSFDEYLEKMINWGFNFIVDEDF